MSAFISPLCVSLISFLIILIAATCSPPPEPHCHASLMYLSRVFTTLVPVPVCSSIFIYFLVCLGFPGIWVFLCGFLGFKCLWCFQFGINSTVRHNFPLWFSLLRLPSKLMVYALLMRGLKVNVQPMNRNILLSWLQIQLKQTLLNND